MQASGRAHYSWSSSGSELWRGKQALEVAARSGGGDKLWRCDKLWRVLEALDVVVSKLWRWPKTLDNVVMMRSEEMIKTRDGHGVTRFSYHIIRLAPKTVGPEDLSSLRSSRHRYQPLLAHPQSLQHQAVFT